MPILTSALARQSSAAYSKAPAILTYDGSASGGNDTSAAMLASGYFNAVSDKLNVGDIIIARNNNVAGGVTMMIVLTSGPIGTTVTTKSLLAVTT